MEAGVYDPERGPLEVTFTGPVDLATVNLSLFVDRRSREGELCVAADGAMLPTGCSMPAARTLGPCPLATSPSSRTDDGRVRFECAAGGAVIAKTDRTGLALELEGALVPFERYTIDIAPGLTSAAGADTGVATQARFSVKSDLPLAPTDLMPGMFFAVVDIFEPIPAQFQFWFWFAVKPETGELRLYAADADPVDMSVDPKVVRDPARWTPDPNPPRGVTLAASGQVSDQGGQRLVRIFPFQLLVTEPPVEAVGTEVSARITLGEFPGAPAMTREILEGTIQSPGVFLGLDSERAALGPGRGAIVMFRLTEAEQPPFASILATGVTEAQVKEPSFE